MRNLAAWEDLVQQSHVSYGRAGLFLLCFDATEIATKDKFGQSVV